MYTKLSCMFYVTHVHIPKTYIKINMLIYFYLVNILHTQELPSGKKT